MADDPTVAVRIGVSDVATMSWMTSQANRATPGLTARPSAPTRSNGTSAPLRRFAERAAPVIRVRPWAAVYANPAYANTFGSQDGHVALSRSEDQVEGCRPGS